MRILFVHQSLEPYVERDIQILRSAHDVRIVQFTGFKNIARNILPDLWQLWKGVIWCDLTFSWFGKLHAMFSVLFSRMLGRKSIVVAGNDDALKIIYDGQAYGILSHPFKKWFSYFAFRYADQILAVSKTSLKEAIHNAKADPLKTKMIYHGFDSDVFKKPPDVRKEKLVVTVGRITDETYIQKGLKLFVKSARLLPDIPFVLVGPALDSSIEQLKIIATPNVTFTGWVEKEHLIDILSRASVYVQASIHEAFGCSIAEAMLCECVPVVSNRTAIPEVVGDFGFYIENLEPTDLSNKIREALKNPEVGIRARQRIIDNFPLAKRRAQLLQAIASLQQPRQ